MAEGRAGPRVHARRACPAARRAHLRARRPGRIRPVRAAAHADQRPHGGLHLAPVLHRAEGRPDHLPRARPPRRGRNTRRADGFGRPLCEALPDAGLGIHRRRDRPRAGRAAGRADRTPRLRPRLLGLALGVAAAAVYLIGSGRVFGYDSAVTFATFIATPSLIDPVPVHPQQPTIPLAQIPGNDHVLLSLFSHVVYSFTGTRSEVVYRLLPAAAGAATAGGAAWALAARVGVLAGAPAGIYIATVPMFVRDNRRLRGYSPATPCC